MITNITGGKQTSDVRYEGGSIDSPSDLDWGEIENYGADSEVGKISRKSRWDLRFWRSQRTVQIRSL